MPRLARAFRPSKEVLTSLPGRFNTGLSGSNSVILHLRLGFRRPWANFLCVPGLRYPTLGFLKREVLKLEMSTEGRS